MLRFLVLLGYLELNMYLQISGKLDQYINLHYAYLSYLSMIIAGILAIVQLIVWVRKMELHSHLKSKSAKAISIIVLAIPVIVGLAFPTVTLDSTTVSAKGYHFPLSSSSSKSGVSQDGTRVQYLKPDTSLYFSKSAYSKEMKKTEKKYLGKGTLKITTDNYMEVMEIIYDFPDAFVGRNIEMTGFIYNDPSNPKQQFLFRFGIIHCIADSGVYGLLTTGNQTQYPNNSWIHIKGKLSLQYDKELKQTLPVLTTSGDKNFSQVEKPSNPYVYRTF